MKLDKLIGVRYKEHPADAVINSHALMIRGGYIKQVGHGIYSSFHIQKRIQQKVETIIRDEMDKLEGQEVLFPVTIPASLWEESGRYESVGPELLRFSDRSGSPMVLGMTHEEPCVHLVREYGKSYTKYPFMVYQIQTKFRDEARPRAGLIRGREFLMKDAYSYHTNQDDLNKYYEKVHESYVKIFSRVGIPQTVSVKSDSGMMGGDIAHEFILLADSGEDTIAFCESCKYAANTEIGEIDTCPKCGKSEIKLRRGIEVGNIFQLGDKYTRSMNMQFTDAEGKLCYPIMGCYGIGIGRTIASVCEVSNDDRGPIWPKSIAPWQVHLCCVRASDENCKRFADDLYNNLLNQNIEVIYDDRNVNPGAMFADADLLGVPIRVIISPRNLAENNIEITSRDKILNKIIPAENAMQNILEAL